MNRPARHILLPLLASLAMIGLYYMPKETIGCANRGIAAFVLALVALTASLVMTCIALVRRFRRDETSSWYAVTALVLLLPALLLIGPLG